MLALLGFLMVAVFMYLIMSNRVAPLVALMIVPVVFALTASKTSPRPASCCCSPSCTSA